MILEMLTDTGKFCLELHTGTLEHVFGSNTAVEQNCRAADRASRQDHFLVNLDRRLGRSLVGGIFDRIRRQVIRGRRTIEKQPSNMGIGQHIIIPRIRKRIEITSPAIRPRPIFRIDGRS